MKIVRICLLITWLPLFMNAAKIVSLAPAVTEIIFALGQEKHIVGCTQFCDYPEAAKSLPRVGGKLDLNLEILIAVKPDIIFLYPSYYEQVKVLKDRAKLVAVNHTDLKGLYESIEIISRELGVETRGAALLAGIETTLTGIRQKAAGRKRTRTLLIAGRSSDQLRNMYIIGRKDFLNDLLEIAGGTNAYTGNIDYPNISLESVVAMNPDYIIELSAFYEQIDEKKVLALWDKYRVIAAVKNKKIKIIKDNVWLRPGPRVGQIAQQLYEMFFGDTAH